MRRSRLLAGAAVLAAATAGATAGPAMAGDDGDDVGGATTVVLDPGLVPTLVDTLKVAPIAPGMLSAPRGVAQVAFPITEVEDGVVSHRGGLSFRPVGGGDLDITNFKVNTRTGLLTAKAVLNGKRVNGRVPVFRLGAVRPINGATPPCAGMAAGLTLTRQAAGALNAPSFAGAFVGDACVAPVFEDERDDDERGDERGEDRQDHKGGRGGKDRRHDHDDD